jgi:hypothetical protein
VIKILKRGQNQYISWILIFGMVVALSFLLYNWSIQQAQDRTAEIEKRTDPLVCEQIGISIDGVCQDFRSIRLNISNTNNYEVVGFVMRSVGLYPEDDDYIQTKTHMESISPSHIEQFTVLKQGTLSQIKIIPLANKNNKNIYCEDQSIVKEQEDLKQC